MTHDLKPYPEYKDSGVEWLGRIPAHWGCLPHRALFKEIKDQGHVDEQLLSVTISQGIIRQADLLAESSKKDSSNLDKSKYKLVVPGDIAYNKMRAWQGAVGVSRYRGIVSPAYIVVRLRTSHNPNYFHFLFRTPAFATEAERWSYGITSDQWSLRPEHFKMIYSCVPPRPEQDAIVAFLRQLDGMARRFIRNRRRLIKVLNEQKQAIINRAVTRGLDPNVSLKSSGVEWLGDIPTHWRALKIKRISRINPSRAEASRLRDSSDPVVFLPMERVSTEGEVDASERRPICDVWQGFTYFRRGDVVVAKITPCFENGKGACLGDLPTEIGFGTTEFIVLRPGPDVLPEFLYQLTQLVQFRLLGVESMTGAAGQQRVSPDFVANFEVPVPPVDEQKEIVYYIKAETDKFAVAIKRAKHEIDLIREYRTRLIADVVTGKVDVRGIAAEQKKSARVIQFRKKKEQAGPKANVHFRRAVFAAEIVARLHKEPTFGHVKFQKLIFLCEKKCGVDIGSTYYRQAAGPYDNRSFRSIDSQMRKQQWYGAQKVKRRYQYVPLPKAGGHKTYFNRYFADIEKEFSNIIETFRKLDTERCEIVATLYSAWEDLLKNDPWVSDERVVCEVLNNWHESKKRIHRERWKNALKWMRGHGFVPVISGKSRKADK